MEKDNMIQIPFVAHESDLNRLERANKRLTICLITSLIIIFLMFAGIMVYFYLPSEEIETNQTISDFETIDNSNINNGVK